MLQAILLNKAGRSISSKEVHWRQLFTASEDSLTSTIFGTLRYLPQELFWQVLFNSCYDCPIPIQNKIKIESIEYWAHWNASNSSNINFIEPDIFIRTSEFDLIVEAKRYDYNQQFRNQWENEFIGYLNHYGEDKKQVFLLAVGGISDEKVEDLEIENKKCVVIKCRWTRILKEVKILKNQIEKNMLSFNSTDSLLAILNDLIIGFRIHGYATGDWFENTQLKVMLKDSSIHFLSKAQFNYQSINWGLNQLSAFKIHDSSIKYFAK